MEKISGNIIYKFLIDILKDNKISKIEYNKKFYLKNAPDFFKIPITFEREENLDSTYCFLKIKEFLILDNYEPNNIPIKFLTLWVEKKTYLEYQVNEYDLNYFVLIKSKEIADILYAYYHLF